MDCYVRCVEWKGFLKLAGKTNEIIQNSLFSDGETLDSGKEYKREDLPFDVFEQPKSSLLSNIPSKEFTPKVVEVYDISKETFVRGSVFELIELPDEEPTQCHFCKQQFESASQLNAHRLHSNYHNCIMRLRRENRAPKKTPTRKIKKTKYRPVKIYCENKLVYPCQFCKRLFNSHLSRLRHEWRMHSEKRYLRA